MNILEMLFFHHNPGLHMQGVPKKGDPCSKGHETTEIHQKLKQLGCFWNYLNQSSESSVSQKHDLHRSSDSDVSRQARANIRCVYLFVLGSGSSPALSFIIRDAGAGEGGDTGQVRQPPWMICKNCIDLTFHPVGALVIILKYPQLKIWFLDLDANIYTHTFRAT